MTLFRKDWWKISGPTPNDPASLGLTEVKLKPFVIYRDMHGVWHFVDRDRRGWETIATTQGQHLIESISTVAYRLRGIHRGNMLTFVPCAFLVRHELENRNVEFSE